MSFIDWAGIALKSGMVAFFFGVIMFFAVMIVCNMCNLSAAWRVCLTIASILVLMVPEFYRLTAPSDVSPFMLETSMTSAGLWLAIKAKFWTGMAGHFAGVLVSKWAS